MPVFTHTRRDVSSSHVVVHKHFCAFIHSNLKCHRQAFAEDSWQRSQAIHGQMQVSVFDDADVDMEEAGLIGLAQIPLAPLADGVPLEGAFPLFNRHREVCVCETFVTFSCFEAVSGSMRDDASKHRHVVGTKGGAKMG